MKIIDFERKGNVVRFYLGKDSLGNYSGDGWDKIPYEQAGPVDENHIARTVDIAFPFDALVLEPGSGEETCGYSKQDMRSGIVPCIIVIPPFMTKDKHKTKFSYWANSKGVLKFYFDDHMEPSGQTTLYEFSRSSNQVQAGTEQSPATYSIGDTRLSGTKTKEVPLWEKQNLTLSEAASYFGIGQNKLRELSEGRHCDFVLFVGTRRMIKRKAFEKYLEGQYSL